MMNGLVLMGFGLLGVVITIVRLIRFNSTERNQQELVRRVPGAPEAMGSSAAIGCGVFAVGLGGLVLFIIGVVTLLVSAVP